MDNVKKLISLEEYNIQRLREHSDKTVFVLNGIACPKCGSEMYDSQPGVTLLSYPPKKNIACSKCDYSGTTFE